MNTLADLIKEFAELALVLVLTFFLAAGTFAKAHLGGATCGRPEAQKASK